MSGIVQSYIEVLSRTVLCHLSENRPMTLISLPFLSHKLKETTDGRLEIDELEGIEKS